MSGVTIEELRDLSRKSRRAQRAGFAGIVAGLLIVPALMVLGERFAFEWVALGAVALGGLGLVRYGYVVGQERGAFRKVFRRVADERRATRTLVPEEKVVVELAP